MLKEFKTSYIVKQVYDKVGDVSSSHGTFIIGAEDSFEAAKERINKLRGQEVVVKNAKKIFEHEMIDEKPNVSYVVTDIYERTEVKEIAIITYVIEVHF